MSNQGRRGRLPRDDAYWTSLAERAISAAYERKTLGTPRVGPSGFDRVPWWTPIADAAMRITAAAVVALIIAVFLLRPGPGDSDGSPMRAVLVSEDPMLWTLMDEASESPSASALIGLLILRQGDR